MCLRVEFCLLRYCQNLVIWVEKRVRYKKCYCDYFFYYNNFDKNVYELMSFLFLNGFNYYFDFNLFMGFFLFVCDWL